jgi:hypothetical protein
MNKRYWDIVRYWDTAEQYLNIPITQYPNILKLVINLKSNSYDLSEGFKIHQGTRMVAD